VALPVEKTALARVDISDIADYYALNAKHVLPNFLNAVDNAFNHISRLPATGSARYSHWLGVPNLRYWALTGFPYLMFYTFDETEALVLRCIHASRDIPASLQEAPSNL
jgi:toxin ParE1/3/4